MVPSDVTLLRLIEQLDRVGLRGLMPALLDVVGKVTSATGVRLLVADVEAKSFEVRRELEAGEVSSSGSIDVEGSVHGRAYKDGQVVSAVVDGAPTLIAPVTARGERAGVLEVRLTAEPDDDDAEVAAFAGVIVGYLITAGDRWTDEFHFARRIRRMTLPAEIQWGLLPLAALSTEQVSLAGALEPAYEVGGDIFDYACGVGTLTAALFDAMGHGLRAARLSALTVATFRNARRRGLGLQEQAGEIHATLQPGFDLEGYATGILLQLDLVDPGLSTMVNAGHEPPLLQRRGAAPALVALRPELPFGMPFESEPAVQPLPLAPGDRLTLYSDGVVEARPDDGEAYGVEALADLLATQRDRSAREVARKVTAAVRSHRAADLQDDATILIIDVPG
jgi:serine phosphatase RsbU (regulator of sigma subunit)